MPMRLHAALRGWFVRVLFIGLALVVAPGLSAALPPAVSAMSGGQADGIEMEQTLYVQAPDFPGAGNSIDLVWLPEPLESTCMGKTAKQCAIIDYCIRTTNPNSSQCSNLGMPRARLPHYPAGMRPRRMIVVTLRALDNSHGFDKLKAFYKSADSASLSRLSSDATIRAWIRYNSGAFEGFTVLEVVGAP